MAAADVVIVLVGAWLRTAVCRKKPLAVHALAVWSLIVLVSNAGNELGWSRDLILIGDAAALLAVAAALTAPTSLQAIRAGLAAQRRDVLFLLGVLGLQVGLYLVPLVLVFPPDTLITGNFVSNDSVVHAILMRGHAVVHGAFGGWPYLGIYPDGFHAVVFALSRFFPTADSPYFLLPASIWTSSFFGLSVAMMLGTEGERPDAVSLLVAASPAAAFLLTTSTYLYFIGQLSVLPFVVGTAVIVPSWSADDVSGRGLMLALLPIAAGVAVYGLFAASLVAFATAVAVVPAIRHPLRLLAELTSLARACVRPFPMVSLAVIGLLLLPVVIQIDRGFSFFASQASSPGNLPGGFLSPLHITGFWKDGAEYRAPLTGGDSPAAMLLAAVFAIQVALVARARLSRAAIVTLVTVAVPVVVSSLVVKSPYINFKYLYLLTAVWVPLAALGLARLVSRVSGRRLVAAVAVGVVVAIMAGGSLRSFRLLPPLPADWFHQLAVIRANHLDREPVLILSREDWFQYYRDDNDIAPMTFYFGQKYTSQPVREILVDVGYEQDAERFLDRLVPGSANRLESCPDETIEGRFKFYDFGCVTGRQP